MKLLSTGLLRALLIGVIVCSGANMAFSVDYNVNKLQVKNGNLVREVPDQIVWMQHYGAAPGCAIANDAQTDTGYCISKEITKKEELNLEIEATIESCPGGGPFPTKVTYVWEYLPDSAGGVGIPPRNGSDRKGKEKELKLAAAGGGWKGTVEVSSPKAIGIYDLKLTFTIQVRGECRKVQTIVRRLYATALPTVKADGGNANKRVWYNRGCYWAAGTEGEGDALKVATIKKVMAGFYANNIENPLIEYVDGGSDWKKLVPTDPSPGNRANCFIFSKAHRGVCNVMGIDGFTHYCVYNDADEMKKIEGYKSREKFLTVAKGSLDGNFPGNAKPKGGGGENRYVFNTHSLMKFGAKYYDATFNGEYDALNDFVTARQKAFGDFGAANKWSGNVEVNDGLAALAAPYNGWGHYNYKLPPAPLASNPPGGPELAMFGAGSGMQLISSTRLFFAGSPTFSLIDDNGDGRWDAIGADVSITSTMPGTYVVSAALMSSDSEIITTATRVGTDEVQDFEFSGTGSVVAHFEFSGEAVAQLGTDGPYILKADAYTAPDPNDSTTTTVLEDTLRYYTPAYVSSSFGELAAYPTGATEQGIDTDADGLYNLLRAHLSVTVRNAGTFTVSGSLTQGGTNVVATASESVSLAAGSQTVDLDFSGPAIHKRGLTGPYDLDLTLSNDLTSSPLGGITITTAAYTPAQFDVAAVEPSGSHSDMGMDLNGNGLYDILRVQMGVTVDSAGLYLVSAGLTLPSDTGDARVIADTMVTLAAGSQMVSLDFDGKAIHALGANSNFVISALDILDQNFEEVESDEPGLTTNSYSYTAFDSSCIVDYCDHPIIVPGVLHYVHTENTCCATDVVPCVGRTSCGDTCHCAGPDVIYEISLLHAAAIQIHVQAPDSADEQVYVFRDCTDPLGTCVVSEDEFGYNTQGEVLFASLPAGIYFISTSYRGSDCGPLTITIDCDQPLPVELTSFTAVPGDGQVTLQWVTASEANNDHFEILRNGQAVGEIPSQGNSSSAHHYTWTDRELVNGSVYEYSLVAVSTDGGRAILQTITSSPRASEAAVTEYKLHQNYPNPFNPTTQIAFDLVDAGKVTVEVYNMLGAKVATLVDGQMSAGRHRVTFDARNLPTGLYFYRIKANDFTDLKKMLLIR